ncbi:hypothetical protein ACFVMC_05480 [Nocardia sp. NPDC127579]|uniref:hypothetical protein n=1 Tax=Nocardia sp. NPDC127579 TaxID=3345402 RepID=UPI00362732C3
MTYLPAHPPHPYYGYRRPGGGTAYTAAIVALLGGLWNAFRLYEYLRADTAMVAVFEDSGTPQWADATLAAILGTAALATLSLLLGAILLAGRTRFGRALVILGGLLSLLFATLPLAAWLIAFDFAPSQALIGFTGLAVAPWLVLLLFAGCGATGRWLAAGRYPWR